MAPLFVHVSSLVVCRLPARRLCIARVQIVAIPGRACNDKKWIDPVASSDDSSISRCPIRKRARLLLNPGL